MLLIIIPAYIFFGAVLAEVKRKESFSPIDYYVSWYKRLKHEEEHGHSGGKPFTGPFALPGPHEPMPGRDSYADYWPIFPFSNQFQMGLDVDPAQSRHVGGDIYVPVPTWGIWDFSGRAFWRIQDYNTLVGHHVSPVNMLGLTKNDFIRLMSDPSMHYNRNNQPLIPVAKLPRSFVPMSCRPPICNPYTQNFAVGIVQDWGFANGLDGELDLPVPISKKLAYRLPVSGNIYYHPDNLTITYGHNLAPVDPYTALFAFERAAPNDYVVDNREANARFKRHTWKQPPYDTRTSSIDIVRQRQFRHFSPVVKRFLNSMKHHTRQLTVLPRWLFAYK